MSNTTPRFWSGPVRYLRWAARERPAYFWSVIIGGSGPVMLALAPSVQRWLGYRPPARIPLTYPVPSGPRKKLSGYDD